MVALLVALTFIMAIVIDSLVRRGKEVRETVELTSIVRPAPRYPVGYFFSEGHTWLNLQPSGNLQLGLDEMIGRLIGKVTMIQFKNTGEEVRKGEPIAVLYQGEKKIRLFSPIDGIVVKKNADIENAPQKCKAAAKITGRRIKNDERLNTGIQKATRLICFFLVEVETTKCTMMIKATPVPSPKER